MKYVASLLLVGVFIRHFSSYWLAEGSHFSPQAVFYMLGGGFEVILAVCLAPFIFVAPKSVWRNLGLAGVVITILEGAQVATCRFFIAKPVAGNMCDQLFDLPIGATMTAVYLLFLAWMVWKKNEHSADARRD